MHSIAGLDPTQVPLCKSEIYKLNKCHTEHSLLYKAFFMPCNEIRRELDQCLKLDKKHRVLFNQQHSVQYQHRINTGSVLVVNPINTNNV